MKKPFREGEQAVALGPKMEPAHRNLTSVDRFSETHSSRACGLTRVSRFALPARLCSENLLRPVLRAAMSRWHRRRGSQFLQSAGMMPDQLVAFLFVQPGRSRFTIRYARLEHPPNRHKQRMCNGEHSALVSAAGRESGEPGFEVRIFFVGSGPGRLDQRRAQPDVALSGTAAAMLARALIIARADASPGGQLSGAGEGLNIGADFCQNARGGVLLDAGNRLQPAKFLRVRFQLTQDLRVQILDFFSRNSICRSACRIRKRW